MKLLIGGYEFVRILSELLIDTEIHIYRLWSLLITFATTVIRAWSAGDTFSALSAA
jgi:hypothetical protein